MVSSSSRRRQASLPTPRPPSILSCLVQLLLSLLASRFCSLHLIRGLVFWTCLHTNDRNIA